MKRVADSTCVVGTSPKITKTSELGPSVAQDENRCNESATLEKTPVSDAPVPNAREIAAAKAARVRLGLEEADPNDPATSANPDMNGKLPDGVEPEKVEIVNLPSDQLKPVENAEFELRSLTDRLGCPNWVTACEGLNTTRQLVLFNSEIIHSQLEAIILLVFNSVKNLRSAVQKSALICLCDLVNSYGDEILNLLAAQTANPSPILLLLQRSAQDKRFVADEAQKLLQLLGASCSADLTRESFFPYASHKSPKVRAEAAKMLNLSLMKMYECGSVEEMMSTCFQSLLKLTGTLISDSQPAARNAAQAMALTLCTAHRDSLDGNIDAQAAWEEICTKELSTSAALKVVKYCSESKKNLTSDQN
uniref:TOG domain-containing protein n=1 Tax=Polyblepharides amylifera TaxID=1486889 RepID=A0A7R9SVI8_9CHLO|mmetsp:Transcript_1125/g.1573  ORF Transcript_1125/g.1573 Transcript_1125/m.1573 type:complete len:363 (+) Transcript_1125:279-1367(+)|eukprot:CAMPEP_0196589738 /NCGR_PEP_ID=MMETSP1081-20130531/64436_1 /TAXON_ID=36882 /ORGANISM="Pyramimonas amylifera, Strain CCMP720" /LENGTH=362 /DNA_ID=CAMNT_0041912619 /DNA_START=277 /DNA_END=1365 /DNA_ORIENTATION=+